MLNPQAWLKMPVPQSKSAVLLKRVVVILGLTIAIICLLLFSAVWLKSWAAERRENITYREIAANNRRELQRQQALASAQQESQSRRIAEQQELERLRLLVEIPTDACVLPSELLEVLERLR